MSLETDHSLCHRVCVIRLVDWTCVHMAGTALVFIVGMLRCAVLRTKNIDAKIDALPWISTQRAINLRTVLQTFCGGENMR